MIDCELARPPATYKLGGLRSPLCWVATWPPAATGGMAIDVTNIIHTILRGIVGYDMMRNENDFTILV